MLTPSDMPVVNNNFALPTVIQRNQRAMRDSPFSKTMDPRPPASNSPLRTKNYIGSTEKKSVHFADSPKRLSSLDRVRTSPLRPSGSPLRSNSPDKRAPMVIEENRFV